MGLRIVLLITVSLLLPTALAQSRAYRTINFGDSFSTVAEKLKAFDDILASTRSFADDPRPAEDLLRYAIVRTDVGGLEFLLHFDFFDDKLFRVRFDQFGLSANYFDEFARDYIGALRRVIEAAHGPPDTSVPPDFTRMQSGSIAWSYVWETNSDGVAYYIGMAETNESTFFPALWIEWTWLRELYDQALSGDQEDAIEEDANDF